MAALAPADKAGLQWWWRWWDLPALGCSETARPTLGRADGLDCTAGQQDAMVPPDHVPDARDWSRSVLPMVLFRVLAPNYKSCGHEVLSDVQFCRVPPTALHQLLTQSPRGSSLRPTCLTQVTAIALPRPRQKQMRVQCPASGPWLLVTCSRISAEVDIF